jgi:hypothetical protein
MKLAFKDFKPEIKEKGFFKTTYESLNAALQRANDWIGTENPEVLNVETVVLPNLHKEEGSEDPDLYSRGDFPTSWHQFVRVWYKV